MKKIMMCFSFLLMLFCLVGCAGGTQTTVTPSKPITDEPNKPIDPDPNKPSDLEPGEEIEFSVCLVNSENKIILPSTEITVTWYGLKTNDQKTAVIGEDGYAKVKGLDGEYGIHLSSTPSGTTYNPNLYEADNDHPDVQIELTLVQEIQTREGNDIYTNICSLAVGKTYRVSLSEQTPDKIDISNYKFSNKQKGIKYFSFAANFDGDRREGTYVIESHVDLYDDNVNPYVIAYGYANAQYINTLSPEIKNDGGKTRPGSYTKNFQFLISYNSEATRGSNIYAFAIIAESKTMEYPITVEFSVKYYSDDVPDWGHIIAKNMTVTQETKDAFAKIGGKTPEIGSYQKFVPDMAVNGVLRADNCYFNEEDGFWYYRIGDNYYHLYAYITVKTPYIEIPFNHFEDEGPALTVNNGTEYYYDYFYAGEHDPKMPAPELSEEYIQWYVNSSGLCYVTKELQEVLQKLSVAQRYFMDGNGWVETEGHVYASEENQWLFACCYYII